jgi:hypothetical protein
LRGGDWGRCHFGEFEQEEGKRVKGKEKERENLSQKVKIRYVQKEQK